jgi:hypothetical protein
METDNIMTKRKKVIRSCNSKGDNSKGNRQYNDQKKKGNQKLQL